MPPWQPCLQIYPAKQSFLRWKVNQKRMCFPAFTMFFEILISYFFFAMMTARERLGGQPFCSFKSSVLAMISTLTDMKSPQMEKQFQNIRMCMNWNSRWKCRHFTKYTRHSLPPITFCLWICNLSICFRLKSKMS